MQSRQAKGAAIAVTVRNNPLTCEGLERLLWTKSRTTCCTYYKSNMVSMGVHVSLEATAPLSSGAKASMRPHTSMRH